MKSSDIVAPGEVFHVEGKDVCKAVNNHCGYESRIMCLLPRNLVLYDKTLPLDKSLCGIRNERKESLHPD